MRRHAFTYNYDFAGHDVPVTYYIVGGAIDAVEIGDWPLMSSGGRSSRLVAAVMRDVTDQIECSLAYDGNLQAATQYDNEAESHRLGARRLLPEY